MPRVNGARQYGSAQYSLRQYWPYGDHLVIAPIGQREETPKDSPQSLSRRRSLHCSREIAGYAHWPKSTEGMRGGW